MGCVSVLVEGSYSGILPIKVDTLEIILHDEVNHILGKGSSPCETRCGM